MPPSSLWLSALERIPPRIAHHSTPLVNQNQSLIRESIRPIPPPDLSQIDQLPELENQISQVSYF